MQHPDLRRQLLKTLWLLESSALLRLHGSIGKFERLHSVSIHLSLRMTLERLIQNAYSVEYRRPYGGRVVDGHQLHLLLI